MAWTGSAPTQTYQRTDGVRTGTAVNVQAKNAGVNDTAVLADVRENDQAAAMNLLWLRNGGNQPIADLPMNSHKFSGMSQGSAREDSLRIDQVQDGDLTYAEASGTKNAIVLTTLPVCGAVEGMVIGFFAEFDNDAATTVKLNDDAAADLQFAGAALTGGEVQNAQFHYVAWDGTQWQLVNPAGGVLFASLAASYQPLDSDLTAIAALTTTAYGRSLLTLADDDALAAEISEFYQPLDATLTTLAGTSPSAFGIDVLETADAATLFAAIKQTADETDSGVLDLATDAEIRAAATGAHAITAADLETAAAFVALTDAAPVAVDWDTGINFSLTVTASRQIGNPTNGQPGTTRRILVQASTSTDRTITFGNQFLGEVPVITDCDDTKWYMLYLECITASHFAVSAKRVNG